MVVNLVAHPCCLRLGRNFPRHLGFVQGNKLRIRMPTFSRGVGAPNDWHSNFSSLDYQREPLVISLSSKSSPARNKLLGMDSCIRGALQHMTDEALSAGIFFLCFSFDLIGTNTGTRQMTKSPTWLSMLSSGAVSESGVEDPFSNGPLSHQHMVYCSESFRSPGPASADCVTAPHPPSRLSHDSLSSSTVAATTTGQPNVPACLAPPSTLQTVKSEEMHAVICNPAGPDPCVPKAKHVRTPSATSNWTSNIGTWNMGAPPSSRF
eukprot:gene16574-22806_t